MPKPLISLIAFLLLAATQPTQAMTAWGEKDASDSVREARTYHIMFSTERDAAKARSMLAGQSGKSLFAAFQNIARTQSKDPGSAPAGGDLGRVREGEMIASFERALFALPARTLSEPVRSEFGWHLIYAFDFREIPGRQICSSSLTSAARRAAGAARKTLAQSDALIAAPDFSEQISHLIGPAWGEPLKDWNGDLAFVQLLPSSDRQGLRRSAQVHIELSTPILSTAPLACRRSARQTYEIDCQAWQVVPGERSEFEGRAAVGRVLHQTRLSNEMRQQLASSTGFHGQLLERACPR